MITLTEVTTELERRFQAISEADPDPDLTSEEQIDLVLSGLIADAHSKDLERVVAAVQILWMEFAEEGACPTQR
jgi:hypothetical protein